MQYEKENQWKQNQKNRGMGFESHLFDGGRHGYYDRSLFIREVIQFWMKRNPDMEITHQTVTMVPPQSHIYEFALFFTFLYTGTMNVPIQEIVCEKHTKEREEKEEREKRWNRR